jgi:hypothetical protein
MAVHHIIHSLIHVDVAETILGLATFKADRPSSRCELGGGLKKPFLPTEGRLRLSTRVDDISRRARESSPT